MTGGVTQVSRYDVPALEACEEDLLLWRLAAGVHGAVATEESAVGGEESGEELLFWRLAAGARNSDVMEDSAIGEGDGGEELLAWRLAAGTRDIDAMEHSAVGEGDGGEELLAWRLAAGTRDIDAMEHSAVGEGESEEELLLWRLAAGDCDPDAMKDRVDFGKAENEEELLLWRLAAGARGSGAMEDSATGQESSEEELLFWRLAAGARDSGAVDDRAVAGEESEEELLQWRLAAGACYSDASEDSVAGERVSEEELLVRRLAAGARDSNAVGGCMEESEHDLLFWRVAAGGHAEESPLEREDDLLFLRLTAGGREFDTIKNVEAVEDGLDLEAEHGDTLTESDDELLVWRLAAGSGVRLAQRSRRRPRRPIQSDPWSAMLESGSTVSMAEAARDIGTVDPGIAPLNTLAQQDLDTLPLTYGLCSPLYKSSKRQVRANNAQLRSFDALLQEMNDEISFDESVVLELCDMFDDGPSSPGISSRQAWTSSLRKKGGSDQPSHRAILPYAPRDHASKSRRRLKHTSRQQRNVRTAAQHQPNQRLRAFNAAGGNLDESKRRILPATRQIFVMLDVSRKGRVAVTHIERSMLHDTAVRAFISKTTSLEPVELVTSLRAAKLDKSELGLSEFDIVVQTAIAAQATKKRHSGAGRGAAVAKRTRSEAAPGVSKKGEVTSFPTPTLPPAERPRAERQRASPRRSVLPANKTTRPVPTTTARVRRRQAASQSPRQRRTDHISSLSPPATGLCAKGHNFVAHPTKGRDLVFCSRCGEYFVIPKT